jgi:predicted DsbA family dithiol-disulfide isomerase
MTTSFAVTFDYLCPFARNAHEAVVELVRKDPTVDVEFRPFSLNQSHVEEGQPPVWERSPEDWGAGVTALLYAVAIRDSFPDAFLDFHVAAFALRHDQGRSLDETGLREIVAEVGLDADKVADIVWSGAPLATLRAEHEEAVARWKVFGVPTFVVGEEAVFVRFMERGRVDDLERTLELLDWTRLNEFKRTRIPR